jgi:hypothetical protein
LIGEPTLTDREWADEDPFSGDLTPERTDGRFGAVEAFEDLAEEPSFAEDITHVNNGFRGARIICGSMPHKDQGGVFEVWLRHAQSLALVW